jgi:hypothetical protein
MLEVETILLGFIIWEKNVVAAMVSMTVPVDMIEFEGSERGCEGADTAVVVTGITLNLQGLRLE